MIREIGGGMVNSQTERIRRRYDRVARFYDVMEKPMEAMAIQSWRLGLMKELEGKVLEVGVGTGKNMEYYPSNLDITAIDLARKCWRELKKIIIYPER